MNNNKLIIAAAGSGKTTYLINEAIKFPGEKVLITTYTEANEEEIRKKFIKKCKCVPGHVTIQTWFSFLLQHGVKPYQGTFNRLLFSLRINGMVLNTGQYGFKYFSKKLNQWIPFKEDGEFLQHYFTGSMKILSDKLPKFVVKASAASDSEVINRISRIYQHIFVDEIQDLAGYDLDILSLLFQSSSNVILVGDPRQVTYLTHHENRYRKYKDGNIKDFITNECKAPIVCLIDETTLNCSHRNNKAICNFSSKLYFKEDFIPIEPCNCEECRNYNEANEGIHIVRPNDVENYLSVFKPIQLRWDIRNRDVHPGYPVYNFGESKGKTFPRVLIYPTEDMEKWLYNNATNLAYSTKAKFYVAITRAKFSVGIVSNFKDGISIDGVELYSKM